MSNCCLLSTFICRKKKIPDSIFPNLEEWACLAVLVDADVAEGDIYGVRLKAFLEGICSYIYTTSIDNNTMQTLSEKVMLDIMTRELKLQIYREARVYAYNKRQKAPDYQAVFGMFDRDGNGVISLAEFKAQLQKLQLVNLTDSQFTMLLAMFDKSKRGSITFQDFQNFAEDASDHLDDEDLYLQMAQNPNGNDLDHFDQDFKAIRDRQQRKSSNNAGDDSDGSDFSDDEDSSLLLSKNNGIPPIPVTRDGDCDWLLWYLYRQAYRLAPMDAESVITDLEAVCSETEMTQEKPNISVKELWNILYELQLQQGLSKEQYLKGIAYLCDFSNSVTRKERGVIMDEDRVDYIAMCKYCVKMGRAFLANVQDKRRDVEKNFPVLLPGLKKYFQELCEEAKRDR